MTDELPPNSGWSSRKLAVTLGSVALATALLWLEKVPPDVWEAVFMATVGAYLVSQAWVDRSK